MALLVMVADKKWEREEMTMKRDAAKVRANIG
jgi:hypothetical protein